MEPVSKGNGRLMMLAQEVIIEEMGSFRANNEHCLMLLKVSFLFFILRGQKHVCFKIRDNDMFIPISAKPISKIGP